MGKRNWLFADSHVWTAAMYWILRTAKLAGANPQTCPTDTLSEIAAAHPISRVAEL